MKPSTTLSRTNLLAILFCFASLATAQMQAQPADYDAVTEAHGVTGSLAFVIIWPLGAILIRLLSFKGSVWIHAATQALGLLLFIVNFGTGESFISFLFFGKITQISHELVGCDITMQFD